MEGSRKTYRDHATADGGEGKEAEHWVDCRTQKGEGLREIIVLVDRDFKTADPEFSVQASVFTRKFPRDSCARVELQLPQSFLFNVD